MKNVFIALVMATVMAMCCVAEAAVPKDVFYIDTDDYPIVEKAYRAGIVTFDEPYFRPDEFVTRAEFAEFLQNIYDIKRRDEPKIGRHTSELQSRI